MGGSSGGGRLSSSEDLKKLEQQSKQTLREKVQSAESNVFISFAHEDLNEINCLRAQAKNEKIDFKFRDHSVKVPYDSENAEYIKREIREKIKRSSVVICYLSKDSASSKWVDWEIRESFKLGKGVIALHSGDTPPVSLPGVIKELNIKVIRWTADNIKSGILEASKGRDENG